MKALEALGAELRSDLSRHESVDEASEARAKRQLLARVAKSRGPRLRVVLVAAAATVSLAAAGLLWFGQHQRPAPLQFWVEERAGRVDEWVTARDAEQSLRFSDGSSVVVGPHTTTRVMEVSADGAGLTLERGRVDAHVVHRDASRWQVAAGPFVVHVTGTRFRVNWEPQTERLVVSVSEGHVVVTGGGQSSHELSAGSKLELSAAVVTEPKETTPNRAAAPAPSLAPASPSAPASSEAPAAESARDEEELIRPRKAVEHRPDFRELSTAGHYKEALAAVEQLGFSSECESLGARDLLTLGSTARLAGRADLSREAYLAARRRFPGSSEAGISAFSLGRLASDGGRASDAASWFQRYLNEQPHGPLAREAAGRLIELLRQTGQTSACRAAAQHYLEEYPTGPHAALARSVLGLP